MSGFLSFISSQYGRKAEDVATDVLAYLMQRADMQGPLCQLFAEIGFPYLTPGFSVEIRTSGERGREGGIPDILLSYGRGEHKAVKAIIEDKFGAGLTKNQPCAYLDTVLNSGIVLFVAPAWRQKSIWEEIQTRCRKSGTPVITQRIESSEQIGKVGEKYIAVISWDGVLQTLSSVSSARLKPESRISEVGLFVDQLRRLCNVEDTTRFEKLSELICNRDVAHNVYSSMMLLDRVVNSADGLFTPDKSQYWRGKNDGSCGPGFFGYYGTIGARSAAWIGFDARLWSERGESPVWIEFDDKEIIDDLRRTFFAARDRFPWLNDPTQLEDGTQLVVPVPLKPGADLDALLASAVERIEQVKEIIDSP